MEKETSSDSQEPENTRRPPESLYHYTTRPGLMGILTSKALWASNIRYLNDASEFSYALKILRGALDECLQALTDNDERQTISTIYGRWFDGETSAVIPPFVHVFVFSMSERGDALSQWRAYCQPGNGYSLSFETESLKSVAAKSGFSLHPCEYDFFKQVSLIERCLADTVDEIRGLRASGVPYDNEKQIHLYRKASLRFLTIASCLKDPAFNEEHEWRLIAQRSHPSDKTVKYRSGKSVLVPYTVIPIGDDKIRPLSRIIVGPSPHKALDVVAVRDYCRDRGVGTEIVYSSMVPFREI